MTRYEYKTLELEPTGGFIRPYVLPDIASALNIEARDGWRLSQIFTPVDRHGNSNQVVAILERQVS